MEIKIPITREHIQEANRLRTVTIIAKSCVMARALNDYFGIRSTVSKSDFIQEVDGRVGNMLCADAQLVVKKFDSGLPVEPQIVTVDVRDSRLIQIHEEKFSKRSKKELQEGSVLGRRRGVHQEVSSPEVSGVPARAALG